MLVELSIGPRCRKSELRHLIAVITSLPMLKLVREALYAG